MYAFPLTNRGNQLIISPIAVGAVPDFTAIDQDIVFSGPVLLTISTNSDSLNEGDEQFTLILTNTMNGVVRATATVTIANGRSFYTILSLNVHLFHTIRMIRYIQCLQLVQVLAWSCLRTQSARRTRQ